MIVRQLVTTYVLLVALAIGLFTVPVAITLTGELRADAEAAVRREAGTAALLLRQSTRPSRLALASLAESYSRETPGRLDVELAEGKAATPLPLPPAPGDPAFTAALAGREWAAWGPSAVLGSTGFVLGLPVRNQTGGVMGVVRISYPSEPVDRRIRQIWLFRATLAGLVLAMAALLGILLARRLTWPLRQLTTMAVGLRDGDLTAQAPESGPLEVRDLARTLNTAAGTINVLMRSQRTFVADASHQLLTPLTALRLALDNVADGSTNSAVREDVERATAEVVRMTRIVNGLLVLAKAEAGLSTRTGVRVEQVVRDRFEVWRPVGDDRGITLQLETTVADVVAITTPGHLEQVLDNVLSNALDFSPDGGTVTVSLRRDADTIGIDVTDQGPGMTPEDRQRAFDRFWRGPGSRDRAGTGLGLAIVQRLVTDDDGTVSLEEGASGGLRVRVMLRAG
ncbi:MAG TPA: HAMP domain-containing sensor histidine kinase [Kineosporiaceae bacterium]